jgi:hypothetical protein
MATTTPNFGWAVPTSTDLVKDGAVAIETLGDSIDASLVDLKGGTTGQVLKKATNTDMDFVWSADSAGMTNPMTTTGDTIYSSSGSTPARLGIGSTGQVLTVASGIPSWAALPSSAPTFVGCRVFNSSDVSINTSTSTTISFPSETFDTNGFHSTSTNTSRITIPTGYAGYYRIDSVGYWDGGNNSLNNANMRIYKNGSNAGIQSMPYANAYEGSSMVHINVLNLAVGDYLEVVVTQYAGGTKNWRQNNDYGFFQVQWLGA